MRISLSEDDILQAATQVKQIKQINSLEFSGKSVTCALSLDNKAIGIFGVPENWIVKITFAHNSGIITITIDLNSDAEPAAGKFRISSVINNAAQALINRIIRLVSLESRLISAIKMPDFVSSNDKSITIDLNQLLKDKVNADITINTINCEQNSLNIDLSVHFKD